MCVCVCVDKLRDSGCVVASISMGSILHSPLNVKPVPVCEEYGGGGRTWL